MKRNINDIVERIRDNSDVNDIPLNPFLVEDVRRGVLPISAVPTSRVTLGVLISCYKVFCSSKALALISDQAARPVKDLRNLGFVFGKDSGPNYVVREDGVSGRRITGFREPLNRRVAGLSLSPKQRAAYLADRRDPLNGMTRDLEIDHRQPIEASAMLGQDYPDLDLNDMTVEQADAYYQVLTKSTNIAKRGACHGCMRRRGIRLPETALIIERATGGRFKRAFEDNLEHNESQGAPGCAGCFYFNQSLMMGQDFFNR